MGIPMWCSGKESTCQCRRTKRYGFDPPEGGKIPWRRKWQPTSVLFIYVFSFKKKKNPKTMYSVSCKSGIVLNAFLKLFLISLFLIGGWLLPNIVLVSSISLQYSCLEIFKDRGAWQATVHGVAKSQTWLSMHTHNTQSIMIKYRCYCGIAPEDNWSQVLQFNVKSWTFPAECLAPTSRLPEQRLSLFHVDT